jgi:hypothetical protein
MNRHLLALLCLATAACAATTDDDDAVGESADEVRVSDVRSFHLVQSPGFRPPPPPGSCHPSGQWQVDMVNRSFSGEGCVNGKPTTVHRRLSTSDVEKVRQALYDVKTTRRPGACIADLPTISLEVVRKTYKESYIEAHAACGEEIPVPSPTCSSPSRAVARSRRSRPSRTRRRSERSGGARSGASPGPRTPPHTLTNLKLPSSSTSQRTVLPLA